MNGLKTEDKYPGTPSQPLEQYARFPYPVKKDESKEMNIIEPDMINNAVRTEPRDGVKPGPSVRAADSWVTFREGQGAYNATGSYDLKCCTICSPEPNCVKTHCLSVCKKLCSPACVVPAKADDRTVIHHMVNGFEAMHSVAVAREIPKPTPAWSRAPLGPVSGDGALISGPSESKTPIITADTDEKPKEKEAKEPAAEPKKEADKEEKPKEKEAKEPAAEPKKEAAKEEKPKEKEADKEEKPKEKEAKEPAAEPKKEDKKEDDKDEKQKLKDAKLP